MVGFAVIGLGMGRSRARLIAETEGARLICVCDLKQDLAREVGEELCCDYTSSLQQVLARDDVDVVLVMTPSGEHAAVGVQVAAAGKHVITTKPMDVSTAAVMTATVKRRTRPIMSTGRSRADVVTENS